MARRAKIEKNQYKRSSAERRKRTTGGKYDFGDRDVEYFKPQKGNMSLLVVPYEVSLDDHPDRVKKGNSWCRFPIAVHYNVGIEESSYICPKTIGKPCPICEDRARMMKEARTENDKDEAKELKPQQRELYNILDLEDPDKGVQLWDVALGNFGELLDEEIDNGNEKYDTFYDPDEPYSVEVRFKQASFGGNKYLEASKIDFEEADPMEDDDLDNAIPLDQVCVILEYDQLQKVYLGIGDHDGESESESESEEEPEEKPSRRRNSGRGTRGRGRSRRKDTKDESEEEPEKVDEESESEEEKPSRGKRRGRSLGRKKESNKCPGGGTFGVSFDTLDYCEQDCDKWESCADEFDRLN